MNRKLAQLVNVLVTFFPVVLLFVAVWIPNNESNVNSISNAPGKYYAGDSAKSLYYNISVDEIPQLNDLWLKGVSEVFMKKWFASILQNKTRANPTIRCGWRWEFKQAEIGAYCYNTQTKELFNYATPPVISYLKSQKGSDANSNRIVLIQSKSTNGVYSFQVKMDSKTYLALPASDVGRSATKADAMSTVKCLIGSQVVDQIVGAWSLFNIDTPISSITKSSANGLIRYQITSGGQLSELGSLFRAISSYTSVAAYCDKVEDGKTVVAWGGNYFSYGEKYSGFVLKYWPLLLMYLVSFIMSGHAYGPQMIKGYDAFMRTGSATYTAIQVGLFNERLYYTLFNLLASDDFKRSRDRFSFEIVCLGIAFAIFQNFMISVSAKASVGKLFTKHENTMKHATYGLTMVLLVLIIYVPSLTGNKYGTNRQCELRTKICFHENNTTVAYFLIVIFTYFVQVIFITVYRRIKVTKLKVYSDDASTDGAKVSSSIETTHKTCFEKYCMNYAIPFDHYDTTIYVEHEGKQLTIGKYIRFCGFMQIEGFGIIRTKDIWILYASRFLPYFFKSDIPISLIMWKTPTPNHVIAPERIFWEFLNIRKIVAVENDIGYFR